MSRPIRSDKAQPWIADLQERFGSKLCCKIVSCNPVQLGGWRNGTYFIPERYMSSLLFLCLCALRGLSRHQLTEILHNHLIERYVPESEAKARAKQRRENKKHQAINPAATPNHWACKERIVKRSRDLLPGGSHA